MNIPIVGVAGGTGSGKTTLSNAIINLIGKSEIVYIQQDSYYKDRSAVPLKKREDINYDLPGAFDSRLLLHHLNELIRGKSIRKPIYDFKTHTRKKETEIVYPRKFILVEGILIFNNKNLRELMDLKIFLGIDAEIRLCRRIMRDINERGRDINSITEQWLKTVKPMYEKYVYPTRRYADIVYSKYPTKKQVDLLVERIKRYLMKKC